MIFLYTKSPVISNMIYSNDLPHNWEAQLVSIYDNSKVLWATRDVEDIKNYHMIELNELSENNTLRSTITASLLETHLYARNMYIPPRLEFKR